MRRVYFDYNATSVLSSSVKENLRSCLEVIGNPSSVHWAGRKAKLVLDTAREQLSEALHVQWPEELVFTGSGTEAINMALKGVYFHSRNHSFHLITSPMEHEATTNVAEFLSSLGANIHYLEVNKQGEIDPEAVLRLLRSFPKSHVSLVSLMAANNETGLIFPYRQVGEYCREYGALFHIDGVQAPGKMVFSVQESLADFVSFSSHKIAGPKGVGALFIRKGIKMESLIHGASQERNRRAGTQNVMGISGFGEAAHQLGSCSLEKIRSLRDRLEEGVLSRVKKASVICGDKNRLVNTSALFFKGLRGDSLMMSLDLEGFAVSTGSACASGSLSPSHVLEAMGYSKEDASSFIRVSLGPENTQEEIELFLERLPILVDRIYSA